MTALQTKHTPRTQQPTIFATEGWEPNLPTAASALAPHGIEVRAYDSESQQVLPWADGTFDLVMNRHESVDPAELVRVLHPGGIFLTQQVDNTEAGEFREWFGGQPTQPWIGLDPMVRDLESAGLSINDAGQWSGTMIFSDVEAVIVYLALIPWDVPDFTVDNNLEALETLAVQEASIRVTQKRFWIDARKP